MKPNFFNVISHFTKVVSSSITSDCSKDVSQLFFLFLQTTYPEIWDRLNQFYADDCDCGTTFNWDDPTLHVFDRPNPRMGLYDWDDLLHPDRFDYFLQAVKSIWPFLTNQEFGKCSNCDVETDIDFEHPIIVSYGFGPVYKEYRFQSMDGALFDEVLICRECATQHLKDLISKMNPSKVTCWV